jgi:hypothetical protein
MKKQISLLPESLSNINKIEEVDEIAYDANDSDQAS